MIEYCDDNVYYKRRPKKRSRRLLSIVIVILILFSLFFYYKYVISDNIVNICKSYAYSYSTESVNRAIIESMKDSVKYSDLVNVEKNSSGDITLISTNSLKVNLINREITEITEKELKNKLEGGIPIPFFAFTGIEIISGYGTKIDYKSLAVSSVKCDFLSEFSSVGINQTHHSIYVTVDCVVDILVPLKNKKIPSSIKVLITESVLVGKVPEVYLKGNLFG